MSKTLILFIETVSFNPLPPFLLTALYLDGYETISQINISYNPDIKRQTIPNSFIHAMLYPNASLTKPKLMRWCPRKEQIGPQAKNHNKESIYCQRQ